MASRPILTGFGGCSYVAQPSCEERFTCFSDGVAVRLFVSLSWGRLLVPQRRAVRYVGLCPGSAGVPKGMEKTGRFAIGGNEDGGRKRRKQGSTTCASTVCKVRNEARTLGTRGQKTKDIPLLVVDPSHGLRRHKHKLWQIAREDAITTGALLPFLRTLSRPTCKRRRQRRIKPHPLPVADRVRYLPAAAVCRDGERRTPRLRGH